MLSDGSKKYSGARCPVHKMRFVIARTYLLGVLMSPRARQRSELVSVDGTTDREQHVSIVTDGNLYGEHPRNARQRWSVYKVQRNR
jgi:hypothetical protein